EQKPIHLVYRRGDGSSNERTCHITRVLMERTMTVIEVRDCESGEVRGVRLDRIDVARLL
ncbi:MAG TPA: hypothetical protein VF765_23985, partial [Polyangiaceae bacterium]